MCAPPLPLFQLVFFGEKTFFSDLGALSQSKVAKTKKIKTRKYMWKKSGEIDMLGHRIFFSKREKNYGFLFFLKNKAKDSEFLRGFAFLTKSKSENNVSCLPQ